MEKTPQQKLEDFFSKAKAIRLNKGETFLRAGDIPQGIYFLKKGYARLYSISEDGKELTLVIYKPGEFFPVVWSFYGGPPSEYNFETLTPAEIYRAPREDYMNFIKENPDVFLDVTKGIIRRFQLTLRRMIYLTFGNAGSRLASILLICAREFGRSLDGEIEIQIPLTHEDLAKLVGVTRETVSLELKKFERKGLVGYNHGRLLIIKEKEWLEKEAILL